MDDKILDPIPKAYEQLDGYAGSSDTSTSVGTSLDVSRCSDEWNSSNSGKNIGNHAECQWQSENSSLERFSFRKEFHCLTYAITCGFVSGPEEYLDLFDDPSW